MSVIGAAGCALASVFLVLLLRETRASLAPPVRLAATLFFFGGALALYIPILSRVRALFSLSGGGELALPVLRATGIALITEFTASFCRDLGENGIGEGISLFGKMEILVLAMPLLDDVLEMAKELLHF